MSSLYICIRSYKRSLNLIGGLYEKFGWEFQELVKTFKKERDNMSEQHSYDAFISYRHLSLDEAIAAKLQELLEHYRPPKDINGRKKCAY